MVLDAKYRKPWEDFVDNQTWSEYVRNDYFQVISYMHIFQCSVGGIICPYSNDESNEKDLKYLMYYLTEKGEDTFFIFPIYIFKGDSYQNFKDGMQQNEKSFLDSINNNNEFR